MNTNRIRQIRTASFATVVAFVVCLSTTAPAFAAETHGDGKGGSRTNNVSPYAVPLSALDGLTLAQYIQEHHDGDPRTATVA